MYLHNIFISDTKCLSTALSLGTKCLFAQVDLFNFGADLIIFVEQFNELLLYLTEL